MQNYHTSIIRGRKCKINLTIMISSSSYPKNIYNMPLVEKGVEIQFEFEFKFKFELKQKRKKKKRKRKKRKRKRGSPDPYGLASGKRPSSSSLAQVGRAHSSARQTKEKKEMG